jgi:signal transduction histidine kinase/CheY-like chemotaxis protein
MLIINSTKQIIFGEERFINIYGFHPCELIETIDISILTLEQQTIKVSYANYIYNLLIVQLLIGSECFWIINIEKNYIIIGFNICIECINNEFIIKTFINDKINKINGMTYTFNETEYTNKLLSSFTVSLNNELTNMIQNNLQTYDTMITLQEIELFCIIYYNNSQYHIICRNITSILSNKMTQMFEKSAIAKKNFITHIFHEIRNYLNVINIASDNLITYINEPENNIKQLKNVVDSMSDIQDSSKIIKDILNDVISVENFKQIDIQIHPKQFMVRDLFNKCVYEMQSEINTKNIIFSYVNLIECNIAIVADYIKIKQVIINLLTNAVKYTKEGKHIYFSMREETETKDNQIYKYIKFEISDDGEGIEEKYKADIFKTYKEMVINSEVIEQGISSAGLSICKLIIEKHNGTIGFNSIYKKGSTFYFTIPLIIPDNFSLNKKDEIRDVETIEREKMVKSKSLKHIINHKILVVDDNIIIIKLMTNMLKHINIENIITARDGNEAVNIYAREFNKGEPFSIVFMDQEMPIKNGNIATKNILELDPTAIIIGITGNALKEQLDEFIKYGAKNAFSKPITKDIIIDVLYQYVKS